MHPHIEDERNELKGTAEYGEKREQERRAALSIICHAEHNKNQPSRGTARTGS
jgi:hypothetical protein